MRHYCMLCNFSAAPATSVPGDFRLMAPAAICSISMYVLATAFGLLVLRPQRAGARVAAPEGWRQGGGSVELNRDNFCQRQHVVPAQAGTQVIRAANTVERSS